MEVSHEVEHTSMYIGMPDEQQLLITRTTDVKTDQYFEFPKGRTSVDF